MRGLVPFALGLIGIAAGGGAGLALRPSPDAGEQILAAAPEPSAQPEYVKLSNQFVIPVLEGGRVSAMVILSLSLEVAPGSTEAVYAREPKLRDAFLQVLFDHANAGGFRGSFTDGSNLIILRVALRETAARVLGSLATDVLISDIVRQDA
ncbi:MAG: flagellar basal body-associated FliL family protein [Paracoccaceae bacterium]|nr:MAG: flagellar basal body-associated FliL family protein [Paracoccaceae bacterium]